MWMGLDPSRRMSAQPESAPAPGYSAPTNGLNAPFSRGGGISGFSNSPSQTAQTRAEGNVAWNTGQNAVNQTGQFSPQALAQGQAAGSNALNVQNAGQRAAQTGQRPMGTPGTAEISAAGGGQAPGGGNPATGVPVTTPPVDPGAHRPNDQAQDMMQDQQEEAVRNAPTIAPRGMYDPNFNMDEAIRQQTYAGIKGNHLGGMPGSQAVSGQSPSPGQDLFQGMGSSPFRNAPSTDLFGRPQNV